MRETISNVGNQSVERNLTSRNDGEAKDLGKVETVSSSEQDYVDIDKGNRLINHSSNEKQVEEESYCDDEESVNDILLSDVVNTLEIRRSMLYLSKYYVE